MALSPPAPSIDRERRYFLASTTSGVSFQLVGVMEVPVFLTWEQALLLGHDLDRLCGEHEAALEAAMEQERLAHEGDAEAQAQAEWEAREEQEREVAERESYEGPDHGEG